MKKIIFFVRETENDNKLFLETAQKLGVILDIVSYEEVVFKFNNNILQLLIKNKKIEDYDLVHFRNVGQNLETQVLLSEYFSKANVPIFDPVFRYESPYIDRKSFEYLKLAEENLPIIDSLFLSKSSYQQTKFDINFPCIAKITSGKWGDGVFLCKSENDLLQLFEQHQEKIIIQPFIKNDGDLRVLVIGDRAIGAIKRSANEGEYRNNVALGGRSEKYILTKDLEQLSVKAAKAMNYSIAGVDLIYESESQEWKIMEVNRGPKFTGFMQTTGINIAEEILNFLLKQIA